MRTQLLRITEAGRKNLLFHVPIEELYDLWTKCRKESDYFLGLLAMNHFYNFGREITPIGSTKLLSLCIRCNQYDEAVKLLKYANTWLKEPPSISLIYTLMNILFVREEYEKVRLCFKYVRENWKLKIRPRLYDIAIKSCLLYPKHALEEALIIYNDSHIMNVLLPEQIHALLLDCTLTLYRRSEAESGDNITTLLDTMRTIINRLEKESLVENNKILLHTGTQNLINTAKELCSNAP